jgi:hypothetical protein
VGRRYQCSGLFGEHGLEHDTLGCASGDDGAACSRSNGPSGSEAKSESEALRRLAPATSHANDLGAPELARRAYAPLWSSDADIGDAPIRRRTRHCHHLPGAAASGAGHSVGRGDRGAGLGGSRRVRRRSWNRRDRTLHRGVPAIALGPQHPSQSWQHFVLRGLLPGRPVALEGSLGACESWRRRRLAADRQPSAR